MAARMVIEGHINLAASGAGQVFQVPMEATKVSVDINPSSSFSGTDWTAELEWSLVSGEYENWNSFPTAVTFTNSSKNKRASSVTGVDYVRINVSTPDGDADPGAKLVVAFS
jgi:hypothetical protein